MNLSIFIKTFVNICKDVNNVEQCSFVKKIIFNR